MLSELPAYLCMSSSAVSLRAPVTRRGKAYLHDISHALRLSFVAVLRLSDAESFAEILPSVRSLFMSGFKRKPVSHSVPSRSALLRNVIWACEFGRESTLHHITYCLHTLCCNTPILFIRQPPSRFHKLFLALSQLSSWTCSHSCAPCFHTIISLLVLVLVVFPHPLRVLYE